jgi:carboxyl-terminal processing protease
MTIQKFYLPNGSSTQNRGVVSDITLPSINDLIPIGESDLPHALAWDTIKTANFDGSPMDHQFIEMLRCKSKERQDKLPEFAFVQRSIARFKKFDETKSVSLSLEDRKAQKVDDDAFRQTTKQQRAELAKLNFPNTEIFLDNVEPTPTPAPLADKSDKKDKNKSDEDDEEVEDPATRIDVHLRESLRVLTDAIVLWKQPQLWHKDGKSVAVQTHNQFAPVP